MEPRDRGFEARVDGVGWGVLFVVVGAVLLVPDLPAGSWLVAVGAVMVGVSLVRLAVALPVVWTTAVIGIAALVGGICQVAGLAGMAGPLVLVAIGIACIAGAVVRPARAERLASAHGEGR